MNSTSARHLRASSLLVAVLGLAATLQAQDQSVSGDLHVTGNVGIGTSSPGAQLTIASADPFAQTLAITDASADLLFGLSGDLTTGNLLITLGDYNGIAPYLSLDQANSEIALGGASTLSLATGTVDVTGDTRVRGNLTVDGTITQGGTPVLTTTGSGAGLTGLSASQLTTGTLPTTVLPASVVQANTTQTLSNKTLQNATLTGTTLLGGGGSPAQPVVVSADGKVGIGTVSPTYKMEIKLGSAGFAFDPSTQSLGTTFGTGGNLTLNAEAPNSTTGGKLFMGGSMRGDADRNAIIFISNNIEKMRVDGDFPGHTIGNVGIGTSTPVAKLDIRTASGAADTTEFIRLTPAGGGNTSGTISRIAGYSDVINGYIDFKRFVNSGPTTGLTLGTFGGDIITIRSAGAGDSGNVGIGTNAPTTKLEVVGDIKASGQVVAPFFTFGQRVNSNGLNFNTTGLSQTTVAEVRAAQDLPPPALAWHYENRATRHIRMEQDGSINVVSPTNESPAVLAVEGHTVATIDGAQTLSNKQISGSTFTSASGPTPGNASMVRPFAVRNWYGDSVFIQPESMTDMADYVISFLDSDSNQRPLSLARFGVRLDAPLSTFNIVPAAGQTANLFKVGSNFLTVAASGNVGLGAVAPKAKLTLQYDTNEINALSFEDRGYSGITGTKNIALTVPYAYWDGVNNNPARGFLDLIKSYNGNTILGTNSLDGTGLGNVGIGTTNPSDLLQVGASTGENDGRNSITFGNRGFADPVGNGSLSNGDKLVLWNNNVDFKGAIGVSAPSTGGGLYLQASGSYYGNLRFFTGVNNLAVPLERMRITADGNVGIGTNTPTEKLEVAGNVKVQGSLTAGGVPVLTSTGNGSGLTNLNASALSSGTVPATLLPAEAVQVAATQTLTNKTLQSAALSGTTVISGNVGIGTGTPQSQLSIAGAAILNGGAAQFTNTTNDQSFRIGTGVGIADGFGIYDVNNTTTRLAISSGGNVILGSATNFSNTTAWQGATAIGRDGYDKIIAGPLVNTYTGATLGAHTSALDAWANLNLAGVNLIFRTSSEAEVARISSAGNLGIGTATPQQRVEIGSNGGIGFSGTNPGLNSLDKKLYSPHDGDLEWMTNNYASAHGFAISDQGNKLIYLNTLGVSYINGGNVGIGTATPSSLVSLQSSGGTTAITIANNAGTNPGAGTVFTSNIENKGGNALFLGNSNLAPYLTVGTAGSIEGKVGIGTTAPSEKLEVAGNVKVQGSLTAGGVPVLTSTSNGSGLTNLNASALTTGTVTAALLPVEAVQLTAMQTLTNKILANANLTGTTVLGGSSAAQQVVVGPAGTVGIGSGNPYFGLDIYNGHIVFGNGSSQTDQGGDPKNIGIAWASAGQPNVISNLITVDHVGNYGGDFKFYSRNWYGGPLPAALMTIQSAGNVGIGTASPPTTLSVAGHGYFTGGLGLGVVNALAGTIVINGSGTADPAGLVLGNNKVMGAGNGELLLQGYPGDDAGSIYIRKGGANQNAFYSFGGTGMTDGHSFYTGGAPSSQETLRMNVNNSRVYINTNVGIGTPVPSEKLEVAGNIKASGTVTAAKIRVPESGDLSMGQFTAVPAGQSAPSP